MKTNYFMICSLLVSSLGFSQSVFAAGGDDPLLGKLMIDQFEWRGGDGEDPFVWSAQGWIGKDLNKLWFKTDGEVTGGETESAEVQALYSRAIAPFWDAQIGWRRDIRPEPKRDWLAIGVQGLAPYMYEIDTALFIGNDSRVSARFEAEYEFLFTQRLILTPDMEVNVFSKDDPEMGIGSGVSDLELGLRLRYEIRREFAPYVGINWEKAFGGTADYRRAAGGNASDFRVVAGIRAWF